MRLLLPADRVGKPGGCFEAPALDDPIRTLIDWPAFTVKRRVANELRLDNIAGDQACSLVWQGSEDASILIGA